MKPIITLLRRSPADRRLLLESALLVVITRLALSILPFKVVLRQTRRLSQSLAPVTGPDPMSAERVAWAVKRVSRRVPGASCLTQALAARILLSRHGFDSRLRLGVAKNDHGQIEAHAWIERDGVVLVGDLPGLAQFVELPMIEKAHS